MPGLTPRRFVIEVSLASARHARWCSKRVYGHQAASQPELASPRPAAQSGSPPVAEAGAHRAQCGGGLGACAADVPPRESGRRVRSSAAVANGPSSTERQTLALCCMPVESPDCSHLLQRVWWRSGESDRSRQCGWWHRRQAETRWRRQGQGRGEFCCRGLTSVTRCFAFGRRRRR